MKYIKLYEWFGKQHPDYGWKNITIEGDNKMCVYLYELANEMERAVADKAKHKIIMAENQYIDLVNKLLVDKVVSFETDAGEFTGICKYINYEGDAFSNDASDDVFNIQYIFIGLEDNREAGSSSIGGDNDKVIVHLDIDPEVYRDAKKYNL